MTIRTTSQSRGAKAKGRAAESAVVEYLRSRGFNAERRRLGGDEDTGDIAGVRGLVLEVKSAKTLCLPAWLQELHVEVQNADRRYPEDKNHTGAVVVKRRGHPWAGDWFCVLDFERFVDILLLLGFK